MYHSKFSRHREWLPTQDKNKGLYKIFINVCMYMCVGGYICRYTYRYIIVYIYI